MSSASKPSAFTLAPWLGLAFASAAGWLWINYCRFPVSPWNDVRLVPVFMAANGVPVYTLPGEGILTTWMYGPVPLWAWWPATLAGNAVNAVLSAGLLNLLLTVTAIAATCRWWPAPGATPAVRAFAFTACLVLWPDHAFRFLQADNVAVALGLTANLLLVTTRPEGSPAKLWLAALATAAALGCKQTTLGLLLAQAVWLAGCRSVPASLAFLARTAVAGVALLGLAVLQFGGRELWFGLVTVPARLPAAEAIGARLAEMAPHLAIQAGLPLVVLAVLGRRTFARESALALPACTFLGSMPLGLAGLLSTGGTINSFQSYGYFLPALLLAGLSFASARVRFTPALVAAGLALIVTGRIGTAEFAPVRPAIGELQHAENLLRNRPGEVWLPWNPLVTYFVEGRFDHAEDGIYVRFITGYPVSRAHADTGLPPSMRMMAFPSPEMQWGAATRLAPPAAITTREDGWLVLRWTEPVAPTR